MRSVEKTPSEWTIAPAAKTATIGSGIAGVGVEMGVETGVGAWAARVVTPSNSPIRMERNSDISV
jgi:hypothetical protein